MRTEQIVEFSVDCNRAPPIVKINKNKKTVETIPTVM